MYSSIEAHYKMVKRILRYLEGIVDLGLHFSSNSTLDLYAFLDADWASFPITRHSTTRYYVFLRSNCIFWSTKKQHIVSRSSSEVEYHAMSHTTVELTWISFLLHDLGVSLSSTLLLLCDNLSAFYMIANHVFHARSKYIKIDYHYVCERVSLGLLHT